MYDILARFLYTIIYWLAIPFILLLSRLKSRKGDYRLAERFGYIKPIPSSKDSIWIHAVSMGETLAALP